MSFGPSMSARYNDTPRFDLLGDAVDAAETATSRAEMLAAAREDAAQSFANARIDAAKRGLASAQQQASGITSQGFLNAGMSVLSGGLQGGFKPGGIFNRGNSYGGMGSTGTGDFVKIGDTGKYGTPFQDPMDSFSKLGYSRDQIQW